MNDALWLFFSTPNWFFSAILNPLGGGLLSVIPASGVIFLVIGVSVGAWKRSLVLLSYVYSFLISQSLVVVAGFMRGELSVEQSTLVQAGFLLVQLGLIVILVWRCRAVWTSALALALSAMIYALFASFIGGMAFTDNWL